MVSIPYAARDIGVHLPNQPINGINHTWYQFINRVLCISVAAMLWGNIAVAMKQFGCVQTFLLKALLAYGK